MNSLNACLHSNACWYSNAWRHSFARSCLLSIAFILLFTLYCEPGHARDVETMFYEAVELEDAARTKADYIKVIKAYRAVIASGSEKTPKETLATSQFAIGETLYSKLKMYEEAAGEFSKVIEKYPRSSWVEEALRKMEECHKKAQSSSSSSVSPNWLQGTQPAGTGGAAEEVVFYDPKLLTPDMYEEVDPAVAKAELEKLEKLASIPHVPPIPIEEVVTGPTIIADLFEAARNRDPNKSIRDYNLTLDVFFGDYPDFTIELKVSGTMVRIEVGDDLVFLSTSGPFPQKNMILYFPSTGQYLDLAKSGSREGKSVAKNLKLVGYFLDSLHRAEDSFYLDYSAFEEEEYLVDIIPKDVKAQVSATVGVHALNNILTRIQIDNFNTSQTLVSAYCRNWRFNSNLSPDNFKVPAGTSPTGGIPSSVPVPEALLQ